MYAIVEIGGRQYNVEKGMFFHCEKLDAPADSTLTLDKVLMVKNGDDVKIGAPYIANAKVTAKVLEHGRDKKILVFKYKSKKNYRRKLGHRQHYTSLLIEDIVA
ncbi:MAG: 50S ribosomal protein L21 [Candidatus Riflebacteria bacterium]|nr:50S ribosomal protein L21 [Candidatus Riflebacteria bacterium]